MYTLTEEHRKQLKPWAEKWIKNAMSTDPMTEDDKEKCRDAVEGLYKAAKLTPPPRHRIVFVSSPFIGRFAAGFAAAIWYNRKNGKGDVMAATNSDTLSSTRTAIHDATYNAIADATTATVKDAVDTATNESTRETTNDENKWYQFPVEEMVKLSNDLGLGRFGLECASQAWRLYQGGNTWSAWESFLTFFKDVVKLDIDYSDYEHWETLAKLSGFRFVHEDFCIICDRPEVLLVDEENRPHCDDGPFCRWRDGSELYSLHGVRVTPKMLKYTPTEIMAVENVEQRLVLIKRYGIENMLEHLDSKVIDTFKEYKLHSVLLEGEREILLEMRNPSEPKDHFEFVPPDIKTCQEAMAWRMGLDVYVNPTMKA